MTDKNTASTSSEMNDNIAFVGEPLNTNNLRAESLQNSNLQNSNLQNSNLQNSNLQSDNSILDKFKNMPTIRVPPPNFEGYDMRDLVEFKFPLPRESVRIFVEGENICNCQLRLGGTKVSTISYEESPDSNMFEIPFVRKDGNPVPVHCMYGARVSEVSIFTKGQVEPPKITLLNCGNERPGNGTVYEESVCVFASKNRDLNCLLRYTPGPCGVVFTR